MGNRGLFIVQIRSDITDVRIRQTDNLPRIARVRENFLISGETGVENDFTATTCAGSRGASPKNSSIFECKYALPFDSFCQRSLFPTGSTRRPHFSSAGSKKSPHPLFFRFCKNRNGTEMIHRPISEYGLAINKFSSHGPEDSRIV